jgi:hypothetical protein
MTTYLRNTTNAIITINDLGHSIPPLTTVNTEDCCNDVTLASSNDLIVKVGNGSIVVNDGSNDLGVSAGIKHILGHKMDFVTDSSGKQRVHQTSRKLGTRIMWIGLGDDPSDVHKVGGGQPFDIKHDIGEGDPEHVYIDFNIVNNETWLHEGYITWKSCDMDRLTLEMVPRVTAGQTGTGTNYNLYGGYMVIPAAGDGTFEITADITHPNNGLVYMPDNDLGEPPTAFWNADYNPDTKLYENMTAAPYGNGRYNMFSVEICFARFLNHMPLLGDGFLALNSSDTDRMGHGMRLKMIASTNDQVDDHQWAVACLMCMHRNSSV